MHRRPTPKQYPSDFIGGKPVLSTGYLVSCSRTQRSASGEARTRNPSISGQALYHDCAPQLGSILCRFDTCPTQYAPDLRGSILCMQGTQYAPRESILCMEHFVALQSFLSYSHQIGGNRKHKIVRKMSFSIVINSVFECKNRYYGNGKCYICVLRSAFWQSKTMFLQVVPPIQQLPPIRCVVSLSVTINHHEILLSYQFTLV